MPDLTRRRCPGAREECWHVFFGDVQVGTIGVRSGVPVDKDQWSWSCGFYPVSHRGDGANGTATTFEQARRNFETAWRALQPKLSEADFQAYLRQQAFVSWKHAMWEAGCKLPTQLPGGQSRCFCGAQIHPGHRAACLFGPYGGRMKFAADRPFADPEKAARKLVEIANAAEAVQDGRIFIELVNAAFLAAGGSPAKYRAGLERTIAQGWLWLHESGTYVKFTPAGAELFA